MRRPAMAPVYSGPLPQAKRGGGSRRLPLRLERAAPQGGAGQGLERDAHRLAAAIDLRLAVELQAGGGRQVLLTLRRRLLPHDLQAEGVVDRVGSERAGMR